MTLSAAARVLAIAAVFVAAPAIAELLKLPMNNPIVTS